MMYRLKVSIDAMARPRWHGGTVLIEDMREVIF
jgi:hypothetical protein